MRKRSELIFNLILVPADCLALVAAFALAYIVRVKVEARPVAHPIASMEFLHILLIALPVWILIFALSGLYTQSRSKSRLGELGKIVVAVSGSVMFMILFDFFSKTPIFPSKAVPVYALGIGVVLAWVVRLVIGAVQRFMYRFGIGVRRVLIVGANETAGSLVEQLSRRGSGYNVVGVVGADPANRYGSGIKIFSTLPEAVERRREVDEIIQADTRLDQDSILEALNYATEHYITYRYAPTLFNLYTANSKLTELEGVPLVEVRLTPLDGWGRVIKRVFDVIGATFGLILLSPIMIAVAFVITITDPGPILYRHWRLSRAGGKVGVWKFRSMSWRYSSGPNRPYKSAEEAFKAMGREDLVPEFRRDQKAANDPRVSKFGRFIRRTSIDELPQLFNVLVGDMSLVGPRPIIQVELEHYGDRGASFLALKPGLTGLWQISGRSNISYDNRVKMDIYYVENWSMWLDITILLKTVAVVLLRRGAY
jgi:exopolysaccharide biosynthesis polyprenyl glycosylphosphotransferase